MAKTKDDTLKTVVFTTGSDLKITIEGRSEKFWNGDLVISAIQYLIEEADLHGWHKHDDLSQDELFLGVLRSVTTLWKGEELSDVLDNATHLEILQNIILAYKNHPALTEVAVLPAEDDE